MIKYLAAIPFVYGAWLFLQWLFWGLMDFIYGIFSAGVGVSGIGGICLAVVVFFLAKGLVDRRM